MFKHFIKLSCLLIMALPSFTMEENNHHYLSKENKITYNTQDKLTEKLSLQKHEISFFNLPEEILNHIVLNLNNNSLIFFRASTSKFAKLADYAFLNRSEIKTPLACLTSGDLKHPYPYTVSYFIRHYLIQLSNINIAKPVNSISSTIFLKCGEFCNEWGYEGGKLFLYVGANLSNNKGKMLIDESHKKEYKFFLHNFYKTLSDIINTDNIELLLWNYMEVSFGLEVCMSDMYLSFAKQLIKEKKEQIAYYHLNATARKLVEFHPKIAKIYAKLSADNGSEEGQFIFGLILENENNIEAAKKYYQMAANQGHMTAQYKLGFLWEKKEGNIQNAKKYYHLAADQGYRNAYNNLGNILETEGNTQKAKKYYQIAADQGYSDAQYNLGVILAKEGNTKEAKKYYQMAADQDHKDALTTLGMLLKEKGDIMLAENYFKIAQSNLRISPSNKDILDDIKKYKKLAAYQSKHKIGRNLNAFLPKSHRSWLKQIEQSAARTSSQVKQAGDVFTFCLMQDADKGKAVAQLELAVLLEREANIEGAKKYYQLAADQGNRDAQFKLGVFCEKEGKIEEAQRYYQLAADQGHTLAYFSLGVLYENGGDLGEAIKYYKLAAEQGYMEAQLKLDVFSTKMKRTKKFKEYHIMAGDDKRMDGQFNLGVFFEREGNIIQAKKYYQLAADLGHMEAQYNLDILLRRKENNKQAKISQKPVENKAKPKNRKNPLSTTAIPISSSIQSTKIEPPSTAQKEVLTKDNLYKFKDQLPQAMYDEIYNAKIKLVTVDTLATIGTSKYLDAQKKAHHDFQALLNLANQTLQSGRSTPQSQGKKSQPVSGSTSLEKSASAQRYNTVSPAKRPVQISKEIKILPTGSLPEKTLTKENLYKFKDQLPQAMYEEIYNAKIKLVTVDTLAKIGTPKYLDAQKEAYKAFQELIDKANQKLSFAADIPQSQMQKSQPVSNDNPLRKDTTSISTNENVPSRTASSQLPTVKQPSTVQKEIITKENLYKFKERLPKGMYDEIYKAKIALVTVDALAKIGTPKYLDAQTKAYQDFEALLDKANQELKK